MTYKEILEKNCAIRKQMIALDEERTQLIRSSMNDILKLLQDKFKNKFLKCVSDDFVDVKENDLLFVNDVEMSGFSLTNAVIIAQLFTTNSKHNVIKCCVYLNDVNGEIEIDGMELISENEVSHLALKYFQKATKMIAQDYEKFTSFIEDR